MDSQQFMSHLKAFQLLPSWPGADTIIPTFYSTDLHCASSIAAASQGLTSKHHVSWPGAELDHGLFHCPALWAMHISRGGGGGGEVVKPDSAGYTQQNDGMCTRATSALLRPGQGTHL